MEESFKKMKHFLVLGALTVYPNHNKRYKYTQMQVTINLGPALCMQDGIPVAFSVKISGAQMNYTTMEKNYFPSLPR